MREISWGFKSPLRHHVAPGHTHAVFRAGPLVTNGHSRLGNRLRYLATAIAPLDEQLLPAERQRLVAALAMIVGIESRIVLCDIAGLDDDEAEHVKQWAAAALVDAAVRGSSTRAGT